MHCNFTSPRVRGEVGERSEPGEGALRFRSDINAPSPGSRPSVVRHPRKRGEGRKGPTAPGALATAALAIAAHVGFAGDAQAQNRRVCAVYRDGSMLCYYDSVRQCQLAISGVGGYCSFNPAWGRRSAP